LCEGIELGDEGGSSPGAVLVGERRVDLEMANERRKGVWGGGGLIKNRGEKPSPRDNKEAICWGKGTVKLGLVSWGGQRGGEVGVILDGRKQKKKKRNPESGYWRRICEWS